MSKVSVVIPTYNRAKFLKTAIDSVIKQTFSDWELIVVDDGSTDNTKEVLAEYGHRLRYLYQDNKGASAARNLGIKHAHGKYIAFLDSDDRWRSHKLAKQLDFFEMQGPECVFVHTEEAWYRNGRHLNPLTIHRKKDGDVFKQALRICAIAMSTVMVRKRLFDELGLFDEAFPVCEDYEYWLRVTSRYKVALLDEKLTVKEGGHRDQLSQQYLGHMDKYRIDAIVKLLENGHLEGEHLKLAVAELLRKCKIYGAGCSKHGREKEAEFYSSLINKYKS